MSYIGNTPFTAAFLTDTFSGNGSTVAFTMTVAPANTSSIIVAITGVLQDPSTYSVSGTTLTFSAAPPSGTSNISVRYLGIPASGVTTTAYRTVTNFTATAGQTSFSVPSYTVGYIDVYRNGVRLVSTDYTATTGTTVVLNNACTVGDAVVTESFLVSSVLNAIPATAGAISLTSATYLSGVLPVANGGTGVSASGPAFNAALANYNASVTVTALNPIIFNVTQYERGGTNYNTSNGRFTAPITGFYFIGINLLIDSSQGAGDLNIKVYLNGANNSTYPQTLYTSRIASSYQMLGVTFVISLTAGQYLTIVPQQTTALFGGSSGNDAQTRFTGFLIT